MKISDISSFMTPKTIKAELDKYVIGQEEAKKSIAALSWDIQLSMAGLPVSKNNYLITGPTGSGKSYLIKNIAKILKVPFASVDASALTGAGYRGEDVEQVLERLCAVSDDISDAEHGIVFVDEFDKLLIDNNRDSSSLLVQSEFLKMIEGEVIDLNDHGKPSQMRKKPIINTSHITFIFAGAFSFIEKKKERVIGFYDSKDNNEISSDEFYDFGIMPELMGRITRVLHLNKLTREDYINILLSSKESIIKEYKKLLSYSGVSLEVDKTVIEMIADNAVKKDFGARGLNHVLENIFEEIKYEIPSDNTITKCRVVLDKNNEFSYTLERDPDVRREMRFCKEEWDDISA